MLKTAMPPANPPLRRPTCRYLKGSGNRVERCTAEPVEVGGEIELCARHLAAAMELVRRRMPRGRR
jgi:hypothetical protein